MVAAMIDLALRIYSSSSTKTRERNRQRAEPVASELGRSRFRRLSWCESPISFAKVGEDEAVPWPGRPLCHFARTLVLECRRLAYLAFALLECADDASGSKRSDRRGRCVNRAALARLHRLVDLVRGRARAHAPLPSQS